MKIQQILASLALGALANATVATVVLSHDGVEASSAPSIPAPATLEQLERVRHATARYLDDEQAVEDGYVDIGLFYANMGWHYVNADRLDGEFEPGEPEFSSTRMIRVPGSAVWSLSSTRSRSRSRTRHLSDSLLKDWLLYRYET